MDLEIEKCGACEGCKLEAAVVKLCATLTAWFAPKIEALHREVHETYERERKYGDYPGRRWRDRADEMTRSTRRALSLLREEHWRRLSEATRGLWSVGCTNFIIRARAA